ncbi:hypothetical protein P3L10_022133 [Capsicum annuum]
MKLNLVSWNVRGLNDRGKRRVVKNCIEQWRADIVCLQETKLQGNLQEIVKQLWGGRWVNFACLEASGTRGVIIMVERKEVWDELGAVKGILEGPWAVCGNLNMCRFPTEKRDCQRRTSAMIELSDTIEDLELTDLPLEGGSYTWFRGDTNNTTSRIDRVLFSAEWSEQFNRVKKKTVQRLTSDHVPISLQCGPWDKNKSYFKFENWLLNTEGFVDRVKAW